MKVRKLTQKQAASLKGVVYNTTDARWAGNMFFPAKDNNGVWYISNETIDNCDHTVKGLEWIHDLEEIEYVPIKLKS